MRVFIERTNEWTQSSTKTVLDLLKELQLNPDTVLVIKDDALATLDDALDDAKEVKILSVISGG